MNPILWLAYDIRNAVLNLEGRLADTTLPLPPREPEAGVTPPPLQDRARQFETCLSQLGHEVQGMAVEFLLEAPFLTPRDLARWRRRVTAWQRVALHDAALIGRLKAQLARFTAAGSA